MNQGESNDDKAKSQQRDLSVNSSSFNSNLNASPDLPFLVVHYLSNFGFDKKAQFSSEIKEKSLERLHKLAFEIADVFSEVGAFGSTATQQRSSSIANNRVLSHSSQKNTFDDLLFRHSRLAPNHLETILEASISASKASQESFFREASKRPPLSLLDSQYLSDATSCETLPVWSSLQPPVLIQPPAGDSNNTLNSTDGKTLSDDSRNKLIIPVQGSSSVSDIKSNGVPVLLASDHREILVRAANKSRLTFDIKLKIHNIQALLRTTSISLSYQNQRIRKINKNSLLPSEIALIQSEYSRVMPQLQRKLIDFNTQKLRLQQDYEKCKSASAEERKNVSKLANFLDPTDIGKPISNIIPIPSDQRCSPYFLADQNEGRKRQSLFRTLISSPYLGRGGLLRKSNMFGSRPLSTDTSVAFQSVSRRFSHSVTINSHLVYPVYCLRFDKTGRYFISGADDNLVKLFYLGGASPSSRKQGKSSFKYGGFAFRGAVLVCSLRGHASVITDIDVSADNSMLATASEDGDCRIWGLKDGCPIAILRGHVGGANMVSWSYLTPYYLVTVAQDGLARVWDVREAALKRYSTYVGERSDYFSHIKDSFEGDQSSSEATLTSESATATETSANNGNQNGQNSTQERIFVPPLPQGAENEISLLRNIPQNNVQESQNENVQEAWGGFVRSDFCDEGVRLLAKLQHGDLVPLGNEQDTSGFATRARTRTVKILCVSRCPKGGHFATGSDDGYGRVWADLEDDRLVAYDNNPAEKMTSRKRPNYSDVSPSKNSLLATFTGHLNSITDIHYSHAGDRILTASQKDGTVRIYSWAKEILPGDEILRNKTKGDNLKVKLYDVSQVLIKLSGQSSGGNTNNQTKRGRRTGRSDSTGNVICDVAVWSCDDLYVITSQSSLSKSSAQESLLPGSNLICVWDSRNGNCPIMSISSAHQSSCPVLAPHPHISSILATAGSDGMLKIWDLTTGKSFYSHENKQKYRPSDEEMHRVKSCGYLDGSFSPDGLFLVITDENGRISVFDSLLSVDAVEKKTNSDVEIYDVDNPMPHTAQLLSLDTISVSVSTTHDSNKLDVKSAPTWMQDQYFASDYYELFYDTNGYAVERGSGLSPHRAPKGSRATHEGIPISDDINIMFRNLYGPIPFPEFECRIERLRIRHDAKELRKPYGHLKLMNEKGKKARSVNWTQSATVMVGDHDQASASQSKKKSTSQSFASRNKPNLSNKYRWIGFEDLPEQVYEHESFNSDDESYCEQVQIERDDDLNLAITQSLEDAAKKPVQASATTSTNSTRRTISPKNQEKKESKEDNAKSKQKPYRTSKRQRSKKNYSNYEQISDGSSDEEFVQFLSPNTTPTNYTSDYSELRHIFRLQQPLVNFVHRMWVSRDESVSGYTGKKIYSPQTGDSVVYIPRAHYDTVSRFPTPSQADPPWRQFPQDRNWPVVLCAVKNIRYRFPYVDYFRNNAHDTNCVSIVSILTLEVKGVPVFANTHFPWPSPSFNSRQTRASNNFEFEVSLFEEAEVDFLIPEHLYVWRVKSLEEAIKRRKGNAVGIFVNVFYKSTERSEEDGELDAQTCKIISINHENHDPVSVGQPHMQGSGYNSLTVEWVDDKEMAEIGIYEVNVVEPIHSLPSPPTLSNAEKNMLGTILDDLASQNIYDAFFEMPDLNIYHDYLCLIEVPMYISKIRKRLEADYYSNTKSFVSEFQLVLANCLKYNAEHSEISDSARKLFSQVDERIQTLMNTSTSTAARIRNSYNANYESPSQAEKAPEVPKPSHSTEKGNIDGNTSGRSTRSASRTVSERGPPVISSLESLPYAQKVRHNAVESKQSSQSDEMSSSQEQWKSTSKIAHEKDLEYSSQSELSSVADLVKTNKDEESESDVSKATYDMSNSNSSDDYLDENEIVRTRSRRAPSRFASYAKQRNAMVTNPDDSDYDEEPPELPPTSKRDRKKKSPKTTQQKSRVLPRKSTRKKKKESEDEFESMDEFYDDASFDSEELENKQKALKNKRKRGVNVAVKPKASASKRKRAKAAVVEDNTDDETNFYPNLPIWRNVTYSEKVAVRILDAVARMDTENLFEIPVIEQYPQVAESYIDCVKSPMDLRTIRLERLSKYETLLEVQEDLVLIFKNCCIYNGEKTYYWKYALTIWRNLKEIFKTALTEEGIDLPRRL